MSGSVLLDIVTARDLMRRERAFDEACARLDVAALLAEAESLDRFRRTADSLYERVRALLFLYAIHRFALPAHEEFPTLGRIPAAGRAHLHARRFDAALDAFLSAVSEQGPNDALSSALAVAYRALAFATLADQVRRSVREFPGNRAMFECARAADVAVSLRDELLDAARPVLCERTPVRLDLSHSCWSDIFFLAMDFPEGARVVNASVALGVRGRDAAPEPPIASRLRVIDTPVLRLRSVDLAESVDLERLEQVFDFAADHLGLLKAGVVASGLVPPGLEGSGERLADVLERLCGAGRGLEIESEVRGIPKGSRLAVSTNLLAIADRARHARDRADARCTGVLDEDERRLVAARAILGEWLGGSGGGWQDSGGVWPGLKLIRGCRAERGDPEHGKSRGRLLPEHVALDDVGEAVLERLGRSLVVCHGGMAQDVGPILEMVTEKYLLRGTAETAARRDALARFDEVLGALRSGDFDALAAATDRTFDGPIRTIVPWATNDYTERVLARLRERFGAGFKGFCLHGGMAGGGMGFWFDEALGDAARDGLLEELRAVKHELEDGVPFAMEPVVYDFAIDRRGTSAELVRGADTERASPAAPACTSAEPAAGASLVELLREHGFDEALHERLRADLRAGRIGLAQNRLPGSVRIDDVGSGDVVDATGAMPASCVDVGRAALARGEAAVVTLAGGTASRWTQGAGTVKALFPFCRLSGRHRTFLDVHLAKTRRVARSCGAEVPHVVTTSLFTHAAIERHLARARSGGFEGTLLSSPGRAVGLRLVPTARDLRFRQEETARQVLDERAQRVRESIESAWLAWARAAGEASDYTDNAPRQCLHPVGHWFELPNLLRNGVLVRLLDERPSLRWLLVHNVDTVGADLDPGRLGRFVESGAAVAFEVVPRRIEDAGGGLARVDGRVRLVEGLALPDDDVELRLSFYNSGTSWVDVEALLSLFGLARSDLTDERRVTDAVRQVTGRVPTYVTIKEVKKRWGHGHEDVFPVAQWEKLWGDVSTLDVPLAWFAVPRVRGQQLKEPAQLDAFWRDGSVEHVESLCAF